MKSLSVESSSELLAFSQSRQSDVHGNSPSQLNSSINKIILSNVLNSTKLWYYRLEYLLYNSLKNIKELLFNPKDKLGFSCDICSMQRQTKLTFPMIIISAEQIFELIHIESWRPYNESTYKGERYFLNIMDDFSRAT